MDELEKKVLTMAKRILIVEDDPVQRRQMARVLRGAGYETAEAATGNEALRTLSEQEIHLVFTDLRMPGMGGSELLKRMRAEYPDIPVVVATAYPEDTDDLKPDLLLVKPFGMRQLEDAAWRMLERQGEE